MESGRGDNGGRGEEGRRKYRRKRKGGKIGEGECSIKIRDRPLTKEGW